MRSEALKKAQKKYDSKCYSFHMRLNKEKDSDLIEWISTQPSACARLKELIRNEIKLK